MKIEVTHSGARGKDDKRIAVGTVMEIDGDAIPTHLIGKCRTLKGNVEVATPDDDGWGDGPKTEREELQYKYELLSGKKAPAHYKEAGLRKAIEELENGG